MAEPRVTVVLCLGCRRSDDLSLVEGRFWCGWCQRGAEIETERVLDTRVALDGDTFRLVPVARPQDWLQPLRVPPGWRVDWNTLAEEDIDLASDQYQGGRNLFLATNERLRHVVDVEYRSDPEQPDSSGYRLRVLPMVEGTAEDRERGGGALVADWDTSLHDFTTASRLTLVAELEACLRGERG